MSAWMGPSLDLGCPLVATAGSCHLWLSLLLVACALHSASYVPSNSGAEGGLNKAAEGRTATFLNLWPGCPQVPLNVKPFSLYICHVLFSS